MTSMEPTIPEAKNKGIVFDLLDFVMAGKKWWLLPILITLLAIGLFIVVTQTAVLSPIIYALF